MANYLLWDIPAILRLVLLPEWGKYVEISPFVGHWPLKTELANSILESAGHFLFAVVARSRKAAQRKPSSSNSRLLPLSATRAMVICWLSHT